MYLGKPLAAPAGALPAALAASALEGRLTIYAGAGVSAAPPTNLPGAAGLAKLLFDHLSPTLPMAGVDKWNLLAVADRVAAHPAGGSLLRSAILRVASMTSARHNYAHSALALLLCEGVATVIETNYDDCIERAALPERLTVVVTDSDRIDMRMNSLLKVHGCATRPSTMLVTTDDLANAPLFAAAELAARLSSGDVAFIGLGSPADYVRSSLDQLVARVGMDRLTVVDPKMSDWTATDWPAILAGLDANKRVAESADEFCDALLRAYLQETRANLRAKVANLDTAHPQRLGVEAILAALETRDGVWALRWLRCLAWEFSVGKAVATASRTLLALLALACLAGADQVFLTSSGWIGLDGDLEGARMTALVSDSLPLGSRMAIEAIQRVNDARAEDRLPAGADVIVACCGHIGPLGSTEVEGSRGLRARDILGAPVAAVSMPDNILDEASYDHIIDSATAGRIFLIAGDYIIEAA